MCKSVQNPYVDSLAQAHSFSLAIFYHMVFFTIPFSSRRSLLIPSYSLEPHHHQTSRTIIRLLPIISDFTLICLFHGYFGLKICLNFIDLIVFLYTSFCFCQVGY